MLNRSTIFLGLMLTGTLALASFVQEEGSAASGVVLPTPRASGIGLQDGTASAYPSLPLEKLARAGLDEPVHNPFAGTAMNGSDFRPVIPAHGDANQASNGDRSLNADDRSAGEGELPSAASSVPFRYMGRIQEEGGRPVVFFTQDAQAFAVSEGEAIDDAYRLERVLPTQLVLVYLPLKTRQTIEIASLENESGEDADKAWSETHLTYHRELQTQSGSHGAGGEGQ